MSNFVTVVSGLPRSGTSMAMQMLAAGGMPVLTDGLRTADEDNPRGYLEFDPVRRLKQDASWIGQAGGKAVKVIYALLSELPDPYEYRVILMERNLREIIASQEAMLRRLGESGAGVDGARLEKVFTVQMEEVRKRLAARRGFRLLNIRYEECLAAPGECAARIANFLERALDLTAMAAAVEPALRRQRAGNTS